MSKIRNGDKIRQEMIFQLESDLVRAIEDCKLAIEKLKTVLTLLEDNIYPFNINDIIVHIENIEFYSIRKTILNKVTNFYPDISYKGLEKRWNLNETPKKENESI